MTAFGSLANIGSVLFGADHDRKRLFMVMCRAYFDASGSPKERKQRVLTVAGYVGSENKWIKFERDWSNALASEGVKTFSMAAFAHFKDDFSDGWEGNELRRQSFIQTLVSILSKVAAHGFSVSIELDKYDDVNAEYEFEERAGGPYGICAATVANSCRKWMVAQRPKDMTLYVFEKGDVHPGEVTEMMAEGGNRFGHEPLFLSKQWKDEHGDVHYRRQFESCDFSAYEGAHAIPLLETGRQARGSALYLFQRIKHSHSILNRTSLLRSARALRIPRRGSSRFINERAP